MKNNFKLVCFLIIGFSYIIFADTTIFNYYFYERMLPGDDGYLYLGRDYETNFPYYKESCSWSGNLPNDLQVVSSQNIYEVIGYIVPADSANNDKIFTHTSIYKREDAFGTNTYTENSTERYQIDDFADMPQSAKIGTLPILENWSNAGWSNGYIFAEEIWYNENISADTDVFKVVTLGKTNLAPGVYCVETELELAWGVEIPLEITVYEANGNNYGNKIGWINAFNCYDDNGDIDNLHQRVYFLQETVGDVYIKINSTDTYFQDKYKIRVLKARPVILVHGINAFPQNDGDTGTTFEHIRDYLSYLNEVAPCICYDFPWDSSQSHSEIGFEHYVGDDKNDDDSLYKFIDNIVVKSYGGYKANIILHSMGGFIVRYQLDYLAFADMINQVLFINSPQYGSDLGNFCVHTPAPNTITTSMSSYFDSSSWGTSQENMEHLSRGGKTIWKMHNEKDINIPASKIAFTVGTSRGPYGKMRLGMFLADCLDGVLRDAIDNIPIPDKSIKGLLKERYSIGLERSDGIVPVTSQNLLNLEPNIPADNYIFLNKHHTEAQKLDLNNMNSCRKLYNLIKKRMNAQ